MSENPSSSSVIPRVEVAPLEPPSAETKELSSAEADHRELERLRAEEVEAAAEEALLEQAPHEAAQAVTPDDPLFRDIESILTIDLKDYINHDLASNTPLRERFLAAGRELALELYARRSTLKPEDVVQLVRAWLSQIHRANPYFLSQDAYIKSQMLVNLLRPQPTSLS